LMSQFPDREEVEAGCVMGYLIGDLMPPGASEKVPGSFITMGHAALDSLARDYVCCKLDPLREVLLDLKSSCNKSGKEALVHKRRVGLGLERRVEAGLSWDVGEWGESLSESLMVLMDYYGQFGSILLQEGRDYVRREMEVRVQACLDHLTPKQIDARVHWLLQEVGG
jgi:hypothetical protein